MNKKRLMALMIAMVMVLTLVPVGVFGLEVGAYAVEYHLLEEMASDASTTTNASDEATDTEYVEENEESVSNETEENATEEAPSGEYEEAGTEEKPSYEYEENATEEATDEEDPTEEEPTEEGKFDLNNATGSGAVEIPVFFTFYPAELVVQSIELFNASVVELNEILLRGVSAADEFGNQLEVTVQNDGGLAAYIADPDAFEDDFYLDIANWQITYVVDVNGTEFVSETRHLRTAINFEIIYKRAKLTSWKNYIS